MTRLAQLGPFVWITLDAAVLISVAVSVLLR